MAYSNTLREEELKNKVANDYFSSYDNTKIIGNIDFCIAKITDKSGGKQTELFNETQIPSLCFGQKPSAVTSKIFMNHLCS